MEGRDKWYSVELEPGRTGGAPAEQTGNTASPKLPPMEDVLNHVNELSSKENCNVMSRQVGAELAYIFIRRQLQA